MLEGAHPKPTLGQQSHPVPQVLNKARMWHSVLGFSWWGGVGSWVGLGDSKGLFQPSSSWDRGIPWFWGSVIDSVIDPEILGFRDWSWDSVIDPGILGFWSSVIESVIDFVIDLGSGDSVVLEFWGSVIDPGILWFWD